MITKGSNPGYYCQTPHVDECTFCITFSFKAEGYTESTLTHRGCPAVISKAWEELAIKSCNFVSVHSNELELPTQYYMNQLCDLHTFVKHLVVWKGQ